MRGVPRRLQVLVVAGGAAVWLLHRVGAFGPLFEQGALETEWRSLGPSPGAAERYPPQGMTVKGDSLIVTNHWNGRKSGLYRVNLDTGDVEAEAVMPPEARHTSGLTWDGTRLWALDHESNLLYRLDVEESFASGEAAVEATVDTGLRGASGLTHLTLDGVEYFAVSDFLWTIETTPSLPIGSAETYVVPREELEAGRDVPAAAVVRYDNGGYSQGLTWDGEYLYESLNNVGTDRIEVVDIAEAVHRSPTDSVDVVGSFDGPAGRIEDLGTDGNRLWTTDEGTYELYRLDSLGELRSRLR